MYLSYNIDQIHQLLNESKKWIVSYKKDRNEYYATYIFMVQKYEIRWP
jgi:hypothetical protein